MFFKPGQKNKKLLSISTNPMDNDTPMIGVKEVMAFIGGESSVIIALVWLFNLAEKRIINRITEIIDLRLQNYYLRTQNNRD